MTLTIVTSHWKEDLNWLKNSKYPVVLIDKEGADPSPFVPQHVIPNRGKDTSAHFKYIIENYENLPDHVAFIHGHETAWHQYHDRPLLEVIEKANIEKYGYIPLNNFMRYYVFYDEGITVKGCPGMYLKSYWYKFGFPPVPEGARMIVPICAQFIVAKERILAVPKSRWESWFNVLMANEDKDAEQPMIMFFEFVLHYIFGEPFVFQIQDDWFSFPYEVKWFHTIDWT